MLVSIKFFDYFRELLKAYPPSAQQWSLNQQQSIISECRLLIEKEFAEDSEDEEYKPDKILDDEDVDDVKSKFIEINKAIETNNDYDVDKTTVELNDKVLNNLIIYILYLLYNYMIYLGNNWNAYTF